MDGVKRNGRVALTLTFLELELNSVILSILILKVSIVDSFILPTDDVRSSVIVEGTDLAAYFSLLLVLEDVDLFVAKETLDCHHETGVVDDQIRAGSVNVLV